jgi:acetyltransferase-like isoleucine patch superfamily enzyme
MTLLKRIRKYRHKIRGTLFPSFRKGFFTKDLMGDRYAIGDHTYGKPRVVSWGEGASLTVGKYCSISRNVTIFLGSEHRTDWISTYPFSYVWEEAKSIKGHPWTKGDVVIGNDVWIAYGATILSGITIGDGAAVGACSLVVQDVPPYAIVAGNPARLIRYRFDEETVEKLLKIKWWNWPEDEVKKNIRLICSNAIDEFITKFDRE